MAINSDIDLQTIIRTFAAECVEHIADMEQAAIALEAQPDDNKLLETIFRAAHTIKGNAASLGFIVSRFYSQARGVFAAISRRRKTAD